MNFRVNKGVTLIALTITIIVMLIITGTIIYNTNGYLKIDKVNKLYNDIEKINSKIDDYYLKYGEIPIIETPVFRNSPEDLVTLLDTNASNNNTTLLTKNGKKINQNDEGEYYIVDLEKLDGLTLNYGYEDYKKFKDNNSLSPVDLVDLKVYIINKATHQIYYPSGVSSDGFMHYYYNISDAKVLYKANSYNENSDTFEFNCDSIIKFNKLNIYGTDLGVGDRVNETNKYNIQITFNNNTLNISLSSRLYESDYIDLLNKEVVRSDGTTETIDIQNIKELMIDENNKIEVKTTNVPSKIELDYYKVNE